VSKLPKSHREQPACATCVHAFVHREYDEGDDYYCTFGAPPRPPCGSVLMDEWDRHTDSEDYGAYLERSGAARETWLRWSEGRGVSAWDICDEHAARETGNGGGE
jgi:hypothetical protein